MIIMYQGRRGAGKTLTMVKDALKYKKQGWKIYSNIELGFSHEYISETDILKIDEDSDINNSVLVIDEIQLLLDSRRSTAGTNLNFSYFVQQIRKRNMILLCTAQFGGTVDLRLRQHTDILAKPRYNKEFKVCEVSYIDLTAIDEYNIFDKPKTITVTFNCEPLFDNYNTNQIISSSLKKRKQKKKKEKEEKEKRKKSP